MNKRIAFRINSLRQRNGFTIEELAIKSNIELKRLNDLLKGEVDYTIEELDKLAIALSINISSLILFSNTNYKFTIDILSDKTMISHIEKNDINYLINCFLLNRIIIKNNKLYYVSYDGNLLNELDDQIVDKLMELFMDNGYVKLVENYMSYKINSFTDLKKYGDNNFYEYLFGKEYEIDSTTQDKVYTIFYSKKTLNLLSKFECQEKEEVLKELLRRFKCLKENIVKRIKENKIVFEDDFDKNNMLENYNQYYLIKSINAPEASTNEIISIINEIIEEIEIINNN